MIRSPSQWPGTARSSASAGRSLIITSGVTCAQACASSACPRHPQRPPGAQAGDQLALERASALDVERLVDRLVADPHGLIIGEVDLQPLRDLLGAPRRDPAAVLAVRLVPAVPRPGRRPGDRRPVRAAHLPRQPFLHVVAQPLVRRPASPSSVVARPAPPSTARPTPDSRACRRVSPRCGAAPARSSTGARPSSRAIARTPTPCARSSAISSRSANDR